MKLLKTISILLVAGFLSDGATAQKKEILLNKGWKTKKASEILADGTLISSPTFKFYDWMDAVVPGTVLTTLLHNDKVPDPFYGMNNEQIPDIYDVGADFYTYWFHNQFLLPELRPGQQVWLKFRGINYSADVFLNGERISYDTHEGMFLRQKYRITQHLNSTEPNNLAVIVYPPAPVGEANGGQGGDGTIARSVTQQYTPGWDWVCPVRDRNTGIWDKVSIDITGPVDIRDPYVKTRVPGKRFPGNKQEPAFLNISTKLLNASDEQQEGMLVAKIGKKEWSVPANLLPGEQKTVAIPEIKIENPKLWWPNGMGEPNLHDIEIHFEQNQEISDSESFHFGIRETASYFDEKSGGRVFLINGQKIFVKGGNWISSDLLLRHTPERYETEVKMHAEMNMNMIRIWGGSITERSEFYEACDEYGLLVWQDLWVTGDCNGRWFDPMKKESQARRHDYPDNHSLFIRSVIDQVKMLRNHPSLYLWCGGNEFPPSENIDEKLEKEIFPKYDETRFYLNLSTSPELARNTIGGIGDGPYGLQDPRRFFTTPSYPFNPEIGSVGMPNVETMRKMMDEKDLQPPRNDIPNRVWRYHKYIGYRDAIENFGEIKGIEDFCEKAQVVNYEQYRALQEGFNAGMWNMYTGMLVWKNQNPWTSLRGQLYDVFLDQNGGFYGYMQGAKPLHAQLNLNDTSICVVNQTLSDANNLTAEARLFDLQGNQLDEQQWSARANANSIGTTKKIDTSKKTNGLYFVRLTLKNEHNETIDENLYWLTNQPSDFQELDKLKAPELKVQIEKNIEKRQTITIENTGPETAFFIRMKVTDAESGEIKLPVFFKDNYITLFPGEKKKIKVDLSHLPAKTDFNKIQLETKAWNGKPEIQKL